MTGEIGFVRARLRCLVVSHRLYYICGSRTTYVLSIAELYREGVKFIVPLRSFPLTLTISISRDRGGKVGRIYAREYSLNVISEETRAGISSSKRYTYLHIDWTSSYELDT